MIRFPPINLKRPIHLLQQQHAHELVRVGHTPEAQFLVGAGQNGGRETERATDDEGDDTAAVDGLAVQVRSELLAGPGVAVDGERDDVRVGLERGEDALAFADADLLFFGRTHGVRRFLVRQLADVEPGVGAQPFRIFGHAVRPVLLLQLAYTHDLNLHHDGSTVLPIFRSSFYYLQLIPSAAKEAKDHAA